MTEVVLAVQFLRFRSRNEVRKAGSGDLAHHGRVHEGNDFTADSEFVQCGGSVGEDAEAGGVGNDGLHVLEDVVLNDGFRHLTRKVLSARLRNFIGESLNVAQFVPSVKSARRIEVVQSYFSRDFNNIVRACFQPFLDGSHVRNVELVSLAVFLALELGLRHFGHGRLDVVEFVSYSRCHELHLGIVCKLPGGRADISIESHLLLPFVHFVCAHKKIVFSPVRPGVSETQIRGSPRVGEVGPASFAVPSSK